MERLKDQPDLTDFSKLTPLQDRDFKVDGIGPSIAHESQVVLEHLLADQVKTGRAEIRVIEGLTMENRAAKMQSIPDDVLAEIRDCHVTLKGPTHPPERGDGWPNLESVNVGMRKALDLFANVRPVRMVSERYPGIKWEGWYSNST